MKKKELKRLDGRSISTVRKFRVENGVLERSHGSCKFSQGGTVVLVSVYGPIREFVKNQLPTKSTFKVNFDHVSFTKNKNRQFAVFICKTFRHIILDTLNPQQTIIVSIQVLKNEGALLSCSINATQFALWSAGIQMKTSIVSVGVGVIQINETEDQMKSEEENDNEKKNIIVLDPLLKEKDLKTRMCYVFDGNKIDKGILSSFFYDNLPIEDEELFFGTIQMAQKAAKQIFSIIRLTTIKMNEE